MNDKIARNNYFLNNQLFLFFGLLYNLNVFVFYRSHNSAVAYRTGELNHFLFCNLSKYNRFTRIISDIYTSI